MDGIIFDVDGTLWDSTDSVVESWNMAIRENSDLDFIVTNEFLSTLFGKTMDDICNLLFPTLEKEERLRLGALCFEYENKHLETRPGTLYPGVRETFERLSKKTRLYIDTLCFGQTQTSKGRTIRTLMEKNGLKDVFYVGDTQGDADACKEAQIPFVFATYGFGNVPDAKWSIDSVTEL